MVEKVKLQSGREIELKPLTFFQRAEIKDLSLEYYNRNVPVSLTVCGKAVLYASGLSERDLNDWDDAEIYEAGAKVFESLTVSDIDKKK